MADKEYSFSISIDGVSAEASELAKIQLQLQAIKKERAELIKQASTPGHIASTEERLKLAAYNKEIGVQEAALKTLKRVVDTANDSLARKKALLIELTAKSDKATQSVRDGMAPAIKKLNDEIKAGENARGVFSRNVGNYPELAREAGGAMGQLTSAVGGTTGAIGEAATSMMAAAGPIGILVGIIGALAAAWKRGQENVKLYLESADKVALGAAGFDKDAEEARVDVRRRASGMITEGYRLEKENLARLTTFRMVYNDEQKKEFEILLKKGREMQEQGKLLRSEVRGMQDKADWTIQYNKLLQEQEAIADEKLAKETAWMALEADLVKQRAIVSDKQGDEAAKKQAAIDADIIANKLVKEKTEFLEREIMNLEDIAQKTNKQEVYEDQLNALYKERNTIQKEYFADQVKINRLENAAGKSIDTEKKKLALMKEGSAEWQKQVDLIAEAIVKEAELLALKEGKIDSVKYTAPNADNLPPEVQADKFIADEKERIWQESMQKAYENYNEQKAAAKKNADDITEIELNRLDAKKEIVDAEIAIGAEIGDTLKLLAGKNKALSLTALAIEKAAAITQIISNISIANAKAIATSPLTLGQPWVGLNTGLGAISIANVIAQSIKGASEIAKYETGGRALRGLPINTGTKDNLLVAVNNTETILTDRHVAALGGSGVMRRIGVPGYANGGYTGQQAPEIPAMGFDYEKLARMIPRSIVLDINKVNAAQDELAIITQTQRI